MENLKKKIRNNKKKILGLLVILSFVIIIGAQMNIVKKSGILFVWTNAETLTDFKSESNFDCEGWFGWCSYTGPQCGYYYRALGDHMAGSHKCYK